MAGSCRAYTVRNATVGGIRDARTAGSRPANAPIRMAEAMPPKLIDMRRETRIQEVLRWPVQALSSSWSSGI
jgi:hypothetical protein